VAQAAEVAVADARELARWVSVGLVVVRDGAVVWRNEAARALVEPYGGSWSADDGPTALLAGYEGSLTGQVLWRSPAGDARRWQVRTTPLPAPDRGRLYELVDRTAPPGCDAAVPHWRLDRLEALARMGSWTWDLRADRIEWSDGMTAIFRVPPESTVMTWATFKGMLHPQDIADVEARVAEAIAAAAPFGFRHRIRTPDGLERVIECHGEVFADDDGRAVRLFGAAHDVTEEHRARAELAHLAEHDPLTGLPNRRAVTARLAGCPDGATLLLIDVDHFKDVNDLRGHAVGDRVLRHVAATVSALLEPGAVLGRLGGDELAVVVPRHDPDGGIALGEKLCDGVAGSPLADAGAAVRVTVSVGVAAMAAHEPVEVGLARADLALYAAKNAGRNRARLFAPDQYRRAVARVTLLERVGDALAGGAMQLDAQPIVDLATGRPSRWELLVRLRDGREPALGPAEFLPAAERSDLVLQLDRWVLGRAIAVLAGEPARARGLRLEVNLSARSLEDAALGDWVLAELARHDVPPRRLGLEMTETAAVTNLDAARRLVDRLTAAGCGFSLDDFGAGFGSFSHLKHLPFTAVKVAGEFVRQVDADRVDRALVGAVVGVARELGMRTVAEQVERPELVARLRGLGVHDGQGYHFGRPRPLQELLG
jgi:diguanylate cyclase (GGDEF)-like protein